MLRTLTLFTIAILNVTLLFFSAEAYLSLATPITLPTIASFPSQTAILVSSQGTPSPTKTPLPLNTPTPSPSPTTPMESTPTSIENVISGINPLTGEFVSDPSILEHRPIAIKVCNYPRSVRPQSGLSFADHVYEYYLERGITRFIAIFYGQEAEKVGPVRSARLFDEHIFRMYESIFVFGNADDRIIDYFLTLGSEIIHRFILEHTAEKKIVCRPGTLSRLCRDRSIASYNNLFANTAAISQDVSERGIDNQAPDLSGLRFDQKPQTGGDPATSISIDYSEFIYARWLYHQESGLYMRFQDNQDASSASERSYVPLIDHRTNQVISADNVIVLFVPHSFHTKTRTTEIVQIELTGMGPAYLFRDGRVYPVYWVRPTQGILYFINSNGEKAILRPGITFFQVIGESSTIEQGDEAWQFVFGIP